MYRDREDVMQILSEQYLFIKLHIWFEDRAINTYWEYCLDGRSFPKQIKKIDNVDYFMLIAESTNEAINFLSQEYIPMYDNILPINILKQKEAVDTFKKYYLNYIL